MNKCKCCSDEHERRSPYCSKACKQADWRKRQSVTDGESVTPVTVASKCNKQELHPAIVANIKRISKDEAEVKVRTVAALRYAKMFPNRPVTIIPTTCEMTDFERKNYKPANELAPGQFNPVSKPGDDDYVCSQTEPKICWRCGKPTSSPLLDTHLECTIEDRTTDTMAGDEGQRLNPAMRGDEVRTMASEAQTASTVDERTGEPPNANDYGRYTGSGSQPTHYLMLITTALLKAGLWSLSHTQPL